MDSYDSSKGPYDNITNHGSNGGITSNGPPSSITTGSKTVDGPITTNAGVVYPPVAACSPYSSSGMSWTGNPPSYNPANGALTVGSNQTLTLSSNQTFCFSSVTLQNGGTLTVSGPVVIKLTGILDFQGGTVTNTTQIPANLQILSSVGNPNDRCDSGHTPGLTFSNGNATYAVIYAPGAGISLSGNASIFGSVVGNMICNTSGSANVHYDEALGKSTILAGGLPTFPMSSWQRCNNSTCT